MYHVTFNDRYIFRFIPTTFECIKYEVYPVAYLNQKNPANPSLSEVLEVYSYNGV
jgi:hypothetical protein